jgi:hypothetical protein
MAFYDFNLACDGRVRFCTQSPGMSRREAERATERIGRAGATGGLPWGYLVNSRFSGARAMGCFIEQKENIVNGIFAIRAP